MAGSEQIAKGNMTSSHGVALWAYVCSGAELSVRLQWVKDQNKINPITFTENTNTTFIKIH
jgi:hypothetical protein